ncbi:MAG: hypothetical protein WC564_00875 [Patescibacteria group bacterium]|jgi:pyroglutamyl-peptidase
MKKVILTGFEPFGPYGFNPTRDLVKYYNNRVIAPKIRILGIVLPCTYFGAFGLLSKIIDVQKPVAVISTGLWSSVPSLQVETIFKNSMNGKYPDAHGYQPQSLPIDSRSDAPEFLGSLAENIRLVELLRYQNIPVKVSTDADNFICNSLGYLTTQKIMNDRLFIKNMFVHIPWTDDYQNQISLEEGKVFLEKKKFYQAIELLIKNI